MFICIDDQVNILLYRRRKWFVLYPGYFTQSMNIKLGVWHRNFIITSKATSPSPPLVGRKEKLLQHFTNLSVKFFSVILPVIQGRSFQPCPVVRLAAVLGRSAVFYGGPSQWKRLPISYSSGDGFGPLTFLSPESAQMELYIESLKEARAI